jgi:GTP-binding protein HflX
VNEARPKASSRPRAGGAGDAPSAVLVAVQLPDVSDADHAADLAELARLVHTLGYSIVGTVTQKRDALAAAAVLGEGKLRELAALTGGKGIVPSRATAVKTKARRNVKWAGASGRPADGEDTLGVVNADERDVVEQDDVPPSTATTVIVDHEITPSQARNLERATGARVLDRTAVILDIFHRHAKSREARLQVEIARLHYMAPRMRESGGGKERQRGKGAGEAAIELDRRKNRDRIAELREQLAAIEKEQQNRRQARHDQIRVALVGYTNAGKSSLMRALTGSQVLVEDKLFATLDTTVRALQPETKPRTLVSDTVGFIKKLPHDLVASFRSTLDEALEASLLLHVVDAADPMHEAQIEVTRSVLRLIGADAVPAKLVFNKADRLGADERRALVQRYEGQGALVLSAHDPKDVAVLRAAIAAFFEAKMVEEDVFLPYDKQTLLGAIYDSARVVAEEYDARGTCLRVRGLPAAIRRLRHRLEAPGPANPVEESGNESEWQKGK